MIGTIERIKNSVLLKCSTLNDDVISKDLVNVIDTRIYRFSEEMVSMIDSASMISEESLRQEVSLQIKTPIIKKIKRKLFIDSLALQITNDTFIEDALTGKITIKQIEKTYIKELEKNKSSNQLNMTENLNLDEIINNLRLFVDEKIVPNIKENAFLTNSIVNLVEKLRANLEDDLQKMINTTDLKYLDILLGELKEETVTKEEEGEISMFENLALENDSLVSNQEEKPKSNKFDKYDDMTLFNKMILSLNTEEEKLSRLESKLEKSKKEVDQILNATNKNIEMNIQRENMLSQRRLELNNKEVELNSKLSEAEVIFLNMKPLIKGLNKIKDANDGGNTNE